MTDVDLAWLAGLLEGEGSFLLQPVRSGKKYPCIKVSMTDRDVVERANQLMSGNAVVTLQPRSDRHKPCYLAKVQGPRAVELMRRLLPYMGERRAARIQEVCAWTN